MLKYTISEDGRLHGEKYFHTVQEEFRTTRPAFRWRQIVGLARVTASAYGYDRERQARLPRPRLRRSLPAAESHGLSRQPRCALLMTIHFVVSSKFAALLPPDGTSNTRGACSVKYFVGTRSFATSLRAIGVRRIKLRLSRRYHHAIFAHARARVAKHRFQ